MNVTFVWPLCRWSLGLLLMAVILIFSAHPGRAAYRVTNLEFSQVENGALVTIEANAPLRYSYFTIGEPEPRLVVDFFDAVHALSKFHYKDLGTHLVSRIRTSQYRPYPHPSVRVVLDMPKLVPFQIKEEDNRLIVLLEASSEDVLAKEQPARMPAEVVSANEKQTELPQDELNRDKKEPTPAPPQAVVQAEIPLDKPDGGMEESPASPARLGENKESEEKVVGPGSQKESVSAKLLALGIREPVSYSSGGRRDPFAPLPAKQEVEFGQAPLPNLEKLTIVGILMGEEGYRALAQDEDKNGYVLRKGDPVLYGYVAEIEKQRVVFRLNKRGLDRTVILKLPH